MSESVRAPPPVQLVHQMSHQMSLNSNGNSESVSPSETDSNEIREDEEITLDQADAWGFGGRGANQVPAGVSNSFS